MLDGLERRGAQQQVQLDDVAACLGAGASWCMQSGDGQEDSQQCALSDVAARVGQVLQSSAAADSSSVTVSGVWPSWHCTSQGGKQYEANVPCSPVAMADASCGCGGECAQDETPNGLYVLELMQSYQYPKSKVTTELRCTGQTERGSLGLGSDDHVYHDRLFRPVQGMGHPQCRHLLAPTFPVGSEGLAMRQACGVVFHDWQLESETATQVDGTVAANSTKTVESRNNVGECPLLQQQGSHTIRECAVPREYPTQLQYTDATTGRIQPNRGTQRLTPEAWSKPVNQQESASCDISSDGSILVTNLDCYEENPYVQTCLGYSMEDAATQPISVYLQSPLSCDYVPPRGGGDRSSNGHAQPTPLDSLQQAYQRCMAHLQCDRNLNLCGSENPLNPDHCASRHDEDACARDPTCTMRGTTCVPKCGEYASRTACLEEPDPHHCAARLQTFGDDPQSACLDPNRCIGTSEKFCNPGTCQWDASTNLCMPKTMPCMYENNQCRPVTPTCAWRADGGGVCVPACTTQTSYAKTGALAASYFCTAQVLQQSQHHYLGYRVAPTAERVLRDWSATALTTEQWRTMKYGDDSLLETLLQHGSLPTAYTASYSQTVRNLGESPSTPPRRQDGARNIRSCDVMETSETCGSLTFACGQLPDDHTTFATISENDGSPPTHTQWQSAVDLRPRIEAIVRRDGHNWQGVPYSTSSLFEALGTSPWGCGFDLPSCESCCAPDDIQPCCQRGQCCARHDCLPYA